MEINAFTLLAGSPVIIKGISVYPPKLHEIREVGYSKYQDYVSILLSSPEDFLQLEQLDELGAARDPLIFITSIEPLRDAFAASLSFFLHGRVVYDEDVGYTLNGDTISFEQIREIRPAILTMCCVTDSQSAPPTKFKNEKARKIYETIQRRKMEQAKAKKKGNPDMELHNLLSAFCAFSPTYNLINVWDLTVYQFYDQYSRLNNKIQLDIIGLRWAAWGKEDFDFSIWYKSSQNK